MKNMDYSQIVVLIMGIYCLYRGFMILVSGKLTDREEAKLRDYSANGAKRYKILNAVMNLVGGGLVIIVSVIRMFDLVNKDIFRIALVVIIAVMLLTYFLVSKTCKNAK